MTVMDFYREIDGDYDSVLERTGSDNHIMKYLVMFHQEDIFVKLIDAVRMKDYKNAFSFAHALKGMCLNLGMTHLSESSSMLCESLRSGKPGASLNQLVEQTRAYNQKVNDGIEKLEAENFSEKEDHLEVNPNHIKHLLESLIGHSKTLFISGMDRDLAEIKRCHLPESVKNQFYDLCIYTEKIDYDKVIETAEKMIQNLGGE